METPTKPRRPKKYAQRAKLPAIFPCRKHGQHSRISRTPDGGYVCPCGIVWRVEIKYVRAGQVTA